MLQKIGANAIVTVVLIFICKACQSVWWENWTISINTTGFFGFPNCALFFIGLISVFILLLIKSSLFKEKFFNKYNFLMFVILFFIIVYPTPQIRPTAEELYFEQYASDYEYVVQLTKEGVLHGETRECPGGYLIPQQYAHLSKTCIYMYVHAISGLTIEFRPISQYQLIVYTNTRGEHYCNGRNLVKVLNEHWHICREDWM